MLSKQAIEELQRMIDIGAEHMRAQGHCSYDAESASQCLYRDENTGDKCFIGALITDEHYNEGLEGDVVADNYSDNAKHPPVLKALKLSGFKKAYKLKNALAEAQNTLHDELVVFEDFPSVFEAALKTYCNDYGLEYKAPKESI